MLEIFLEFVMVRTGEVGSEKGGLLFERGSEDSLRSSREHDCWYPHFLGTFVLGQMAYLASAPIQSTLRFAIASRKHGRKALSEILDGSREQAIHCLQYLNALTNLLLSEFSQIKLCLLLQKRYHHNQARVCWFMVTWCKVIIPLNLQSVPCAMRPHIVIVIRSNIKEPDSKVPGPMS
jgi:hypothetical protein